MILLQALVPPLIFFLSAALGIRTPDMFSLLASWIFWLAYWPFIVYPGYLISGRGRRWSLNKTIATSYGFVALFYLLLSWTPMVYSMEIGGRVLVRDGMPTAAYYEELIGSVIMAGCAVLLGAMIFRRLCR
jgi:hypothetical protein